MNIRCLIESLKQSSKSGILHISNVDKIIDKLEEMDAMIEMEDVKKAFVSQLLLILTMRRRGCVPPFKKMHSIFSGPPGVGKTSMSILVAQIWSYLNIMDKSKQSTISEAEPILNNASELKFSDCVVSPIDASLKIRYKRDIAHTMSDVRDKMTDIMLSLDKEHEDNEPEEIPEYIKLIYTRSQKSVELCNNIIDKYGKYFKEIDKDDIILDDDNTKSSSEEEPYVVLGRGDFIGAFQGETSIKTKEVLENNRGKIIILEEAYSFFLDQRDSYGMEALTIINRYMDEHCDDYIFIFNGYSDMLEQTIFKAQPGLRRRIQWTFNVDGYTSEGLFRIFKHQLGRYNDPQWKLNPKDIPKIETFFNLNSHYFPYFGGDTEKLILQSQLTYGEKYFGIMDEIKIGEPCFLSYNTILLAFAKYKELTKTYDTKERCDMPDFMYS